MYPVRSARVGAVKHGRKSTLVNDHRVVCYYVEHRIVDTRSEVDVVVKESCLPLVSVTELRYCSRPIFNYSHKHALLVRGLYELFHGA